LIYAGMQISQLSPAQLRDSGSQMALCKHPKSSCFLGPLHR